MAGKRKQHTAAFKARVALAALQGDRTVNELACPGGVHPTLIHPWKKRLRTGADQVFSNGSKAATADAQAQEAELFEQIGRPKMELARLKKKAGRSPDRLRPLVDAADPALSVRRPCRLLGLSRPSLSYEPVAETADNLRLMRLLDEEYPAHPFLGSRRRTAWLTAQGGAVNRKRVQRLVRRMGLGAIYPKPQLRAARAGHRVYPYWPRNGTIQRPDRVGSTGIPYVPPARGFLYLAAVIAWFSRYVLAGRRSNTVGGSFCLGMLGDALSRGRPEAFNTDPGVPFTAAAWAGRLESAGVAVSGDGRGRCRDNVFVERLGRTVKDEDIYLRGYEAVPAPQRGLGRYFPYYNDERRRQALGYRAPAAVYEQGRAGGRPAG
jgi:putative transposase